MGTAKVNFTDARARAIGGPTGTADRVYHRDSEVGGLCLCVTAKGSRVWWWNGRIAGRPERLRIGDLSKVTVKLARAEAKRINGQVSAGDNPAAEARALDAETTLGQHFEVFIHEPNAKNGRPKRPRSVAGYRQQFDSHLAHLAARRLSEITTAHLQAVRLAMADHPYQANRVMALAKALFNSARRHGFTGSNPVVGIKPYVEAKRARFLERAEVGPFLRALDAEPNPDLADFLRVALFTGQRRNTLCRMRWEHIDLDRRVWCIPGEDMKAGEALDVPLVDDVAAILRRRRYDAEAVAADRQRPASAYVFPGRRGGCMTEPKSAMARACAAAGVNGLRLHDLRRTLATFAVIAGVPDPTRRRMLGHALPAGDASAVYARPDFAAVREGFDRAVAAIKAAAAPPAPTTATGQKGGRRRGRTVASE